MRNSGDHTVPLPSRQSLSIDFLENRVSMPEFFYETGCPHFKYDPEKGKFVPRVYTRAVNREFDSLGGGKRLKAATGSFMKAIQVYKTSAKNDPFAQLQFGPSCNWETVLKTVRDAEETYFSERSTRDKVRIAFHKIGDNIEMIQPFLNLLPQGDYQILCGGLQIATGALIRNSQIRDKIASLLEEIVNPLQSGEVLANIYGDNQRFRDGLEKLYIAILEALAEIVTWYSQQLRKRAILKAILLGPMYKESIDTKIDSVRAAWTQFDNVAVDCNRVKVAGIEYSVANIRTIIANGIKSISDDLLAQKKWFKHEEKRRRKQNKTTAQLTANENQHSRKADEMATDGDAASRYTSEQLRETLGLGKVHNSHAETAVTEGERKDAKFGGRTEHIVNTKEFTTWLASKGSSLLMVNGNGRFEDSTMSPCSFATGLLVDKLQKFEKTIVLQYFCGRSFRYKEGTAPPQVPQNVLPLVQGLFQQLLNHEKVDAISEHSKWPHLSFLKHETVEKMKNGSSRAYSEAIQSLLQSFANDDFEIYVLIDGIDNYSIHEELKCQRVMTSLSNLVEWGNDSTGAAKDRPGRAVKVLLTAFSHCKEFKSVSPQVPSEVSHILNMPSSVNRSKQYNRAWWEIHCKKLNFYHLPHKN